MKNFSKSLLVLTLIGVISAAAHASDFIPAGFVNSPSDERAIDPYAAPFKNNTNTHLEQSDWMDPANTNLKVAVRQAYISALSSSDSCVVFIEFAYDGFQFGNEPELALKDLQTNRVTKLTDVVTLREGIYDQGAVKRYVGQDVVRRSYYILALSLSNQSASCSAGASFAVMMGGNTIGPIKIVK